MNFNRNFSDVYHTLYDHLLLDVGDIRGVSIGMTLDRALDKFCLQM